MLRVMEANNKYYVPSCTPRMLIEGIANELDAVYATFLASVTRSQEAEDTV